MNSIQAGVELIKNKLTIIKEEEFKECHHQNRSLLNVKFIKVAANKMLICVLLLSSFSMKVKQLIILTEKPVGKIVDKRIS